MGREVRRKFERREVRKALGEDAAFWTAQCVDVIWCRGFIGRLKWLFLGR